MQYNEEQKKAEKQASIENGKEATYSLLKGIAKKSDKAVVHKEYDSKQCSNKQSNKVISNGDIV